MTLTARFFIRPALVTAALLLVPLVAMQLTREVAWTPADFAVAGALLFGAGLAYEGVARQRGGWPYRLAVGAAVGTALLLLWANLAVGLVGSEDNPLNWLYAGVLAVGLVGALAARLRPAGLARVLVATALAQALAAVAALLLARQGIGGELVPAAELLAVNAVFVALWLGAAALFWRAAR